VVNDFRHQSYKNAVPPIVMVDEPIWFRTIVIRLTGVNSSQTVDRIEKIWNEIYADYKMEYAFLDELYNDMYAPEKARLHLIFAFSILAILIALLGIFGLVSFALKTRTQEIAIRKVMGAGYRSLAFLFAKEYFILSLVGMVVSIPITLIGIRSWLSSFAYRIHL